MSLRVGISLTGVQRDLEFGATSGAERHQRVVGSGLHRNLIVADILIANGDVVGAKPVPVDQIGHVGRGGATIEIIAADRRLGRDLEAFVLNHGIAKFVRQRQINHRKAGSAQREIVGKADAIGDGSSGAGLTEHEDRPRRPTANRRYRCSDSFGKTECWRKPAAPGPSPARPSRPRRENSWTYVPPIGTFMWFVDHGRATL